MAENNNEGTSERSEEVFSINLRTKLRSFLGLGALRVRNVFGGGLGVMWGEAWTRYDWAEVQAAAQPSGPAGWTELSLSSQDVTIKEISARVALDRAQSDKKE
jgi:hypothetical protein